MDNKEGIQQLKRRITDTLLPLIGKKCVLYDTPFYKNIGDVLIWQGELSFLEDNNIEILDYADYHTYRKKELSEDVTILFQGGGNIGDLYHEHTDLLLQLVEDYPNNRIIVFSQTVYYKDQDLFNSDFARLASHKDLYFCARDNSVYNIIKPKLDTKALVLPDMAFCINENYLNQWRKETSKQSLYIRRNDVESAGLSYATNYTKITDWPCFETKFMWTNVGNTLYDRCYKYIPFLRDLIRNPWKQYAYNTFRNLMIKDGVEFISPYKEVTSERLHGCILSILLGKIVTVVNNSYGKKSQFLQLLVSGF